MFVHKKCDNCNRILSNDSTVTLLIPDVQVDKNGHLKISTNGVEIRTAKVYCKKCLDISKHILRKDNNA